MLIIGIPVRNDKESFAEMMNSLLTSTKAYDKIVVIESDSTDGTAELCDELASFKFINFEVIHTKKEGPLKAYNRLFQIAKENKADLFLTQSDVVFPRLFHRDWLNIMSQIANSPGVGGVMSIGGGGKSGPDYINGLEWMGGWCSLFPYKTIETIGGYDESFPNGYGVDIDHSYRILRARLDIVTMNYWVDHHMLNSREHDNDPKTEEAKKEASNYFKKKWGII